MSIKIKVGKAFQIFLDINQNKIGVKNMLKNKSIDYIFGMITGASLMLAFWACTSNDLVASSGTIQEVKVVNVQQLMQKYIILLNFILIMLKILI